MSLRNYFVRLTPSKVSLAFILLVTIWVSSNLNWGKDFWKNIVVADAKGYYAYLPAAFIYHDMNFGFADAIEKQKYPDPQHYFEYRISVENKVVDKYYAGTAVAQAPFFLIAHGLSNVFGLPTDGYSKLYAIFVNIAAIFYLFAGLLFLRKILLRHTASDWLAAFVLMSIVFGTNLFFYTVSEPGMSHVYSFAFVSLFMWLVMEYFKSGKWLVLIAVVFAMIVLIRPVNGLVLLSVPFLAGNKADFLRGIRALVQFRLRLFLAVTLAIAVLFIQLICYKVATGSFFVYSYGGEQLNLLNPHLFDILFSYRKGLFLYTPLLLVSLVGFSYFYRSSRYLFFTLLAFLFAVVYILSSWWMWYYGGSFSGRVFVEYLPYFAILLCAALAGSGKKVRAVLVSVVCVLVVFCQFQTYQYRYYLIHWSDMTQEKYWDVFLKLPH